MKSLAPIIAIVLLGACDSNPAAAPEPQPTSLASSEPAQASIMRPDIATPTEAPAPVEPLEVAIGFPGGGADIAEAEIAKLETLVASVQVKQGGPIRLGAHSDAGGGDAANLAVSRARGEAVRDWLVEHGIAEERLTLVLFGEQNPVRPNALPDGSPDEAGRAANRRVEIHVPVAAAPSAEPRQQTLAEEIVGSTEAEPGIGRDGD